MIKCWLLGFLIIFWHSPSYSKSSLGAAQLVAKWSNHKRFRMEDFTIGEQNFFATIWLPRDFSKEKKSGARLPALILFSGYSEAAKSHKRSAFGWLEDYGITSVMGHLEQGVVSTSMFKGMVSPSEMKRYRTLLKKFPFKPMLIVSITTMGRMPFEEKTYSEYETWITRDLIRRLKNKYHVDGKLLGIDGVSWGGAWSLYLFSKFPKIFRSRGALQPAYRSMDLVKRHFKRYQGLKQHPFYIATSKKDYLRRAIENLSRWMGRKGLPHQFYMLSGNHSYAFNQGPGAVHALIWHNMALNYNVARPDKFR